MQDQLLKALLLNVPEARVFSRPMSKDARHLLEDIIGWGVSKCSSLFKVPSPSVACIKAFASEYQVLKFEEACHRWDMKQYISVVAKAYSPNKAENLTNIMLLKNLDDESWIQNNAMKSNANRVGSLRGERTVALYEWLTTYFVMTDFNSFDLNKIVEMSGEEFNFELLKAEANKVTDSDKKKIAYLYAIMRDIMSRDEVVRSQEKIIGEKYEEKLKKVFEYSGPKIQHVNPDKTAEWKRERLWLEVAEDLKKK